MLAHIVCRDEYELVPVTCSYMEAARRMAREGIHALYVLDGDRLVGVVCHIDFIYPLRDAPSIPHGLTVQEIMSSPVRSLGLDSTVGAAKSLFETTRFVIIPVVDESGRLVGAISSHDLFRQMSLCPNDSVTSLKALARQ